MLLCDIIEKIFIVFVTLLDHKLYAADLVAMVGIVCYECICLGCCTVWKEYKIFTFINY